MFYVVDADFFLAFSDGYNTRAEAEAELENVKAWARENNWEHNFVVSEIVKEFKPLETIDPLFE